MAKIQYIKKSNRGNEVKCNKCGKVIEPGQMYYKAEPYAGPVITRCSDCGLRSYETSGSSYIQTIGRLVENWRVEYADMNCAAEDIASELEDLKDELESNLENIPEQLQDGAAGTLLQERIEELEDCISALQDIVYDDIAEEAWNSASDSIGEFDPGDEDRDYATVEEWTEAVNDEMDDVDDLVADAIDEALSYLSY